MPAADLRAAYPLTLRHLGEGFLDVYLADGKAAPFVEHVQARFSQGTIPDRAVRDLVRYEHERVRLGALPALAAPKEDPPGDDVPVRLSPDVALVMYGADLPGVLAALREGRPAQPRPRRAWVLLVPRGGGALEERELDREDGWVMEWFREPTTYADVAAMLGERTAFDALWREGLLVRA